jgi:hypothetical protein
LNYDHSQNINNKPRILFLGCSFTYGDACLAEETFPFLIEKELNGYTINAGVCSYGLSQMYLLAQKLIPEYKPDLVVFQHSSWLADRALDQYAPVYYGVLPTPYFGKDNSVLPPLFSSHLFNYPADQFRDTKKSFSDYFSFLSISFPLYMKDDFSKCVKYVELLFHFIPKPNRDEKNAEQFAITRVHDICKKNNCRMILLNISSPGDTKMYYMPDAKENIPVANADSALYANLGNETYERKYGHYRMSGTDSVFVDPHPNAAAHKIIAHEIIRVINSIKPAER